MLRKKNTLLGIVIFSLLILVLSGCGGSKDGNGGGNDDPIFIDFDAEAFEGTTWRCEEAGDRPKITVYIDEIAGELTGQYSYSGSVVCTTTGTMNITGEENVIETLRKHIWLMGYEIGGNQYISFLVAGTDDDENYIQIDGYITANDPNTMTVAYLLVDYYDEMAYSDYEYDEEESPEIVVLEKIFL